MGVAKSSFTVPDIVLMDINLPHTNGLTAIKHIKADNPGCCVIVVTMFNTNEFKELAKKLDVEAFVAKTDIYECLLPIITKYLSEKGQKLINK